MIKKKENEFRAYEERLKLLREEINKVINLHIFIFCNFYLNRFVIYFQ